MCRATVILCVSGHFIGVREVAGCQGVAGILLEDC